MAFKKKKKTNIPRNVKKLVCAFAVFPGGGTEQDPGEVQRLRRSPLPQQALATTAVAVDRAWKAWGGLDVITYRSASLSSSNPTGLLSFTGATD